MLTGILKKILVCGMLAMGLIIAGIVLGWNDPQSNPPNNNALKPIDIGPLDESKPAQIQALTISSGKIGPCETGILSLTDSENQSLWQFSNRQSGCDGNNDLALFHFTGTNPGSGQSSDAWYGPYLWISKASGNVGIGASSPLYKLTVSGQGHFSRDNIDECCSEGDFSLSLAEKTAGSGGTGQRATLQFHNNGQSEGYLKLNPGPYGRELLAGSWQTDMDLRATGVIRAEQALCIGAECKSAWPEGMTIASSCPEDEFMTGITAQGEIICDNVAARFFEPNPCTGNPPGNGKKIFVTSSVYLGSEITNETNADEKCQATATKAGHSGVYKALIYLGNRQLSSALSNTASYYNGIRSANGQSCVWNSVATGLTDFFTADANGNYLSNPIKANEQAFETSTLVWTNFRPANPGSYETLQPYYSEGSCGWTGACLSSITRTGLCNCAWWGGACTYVYSMKAQAIYGLNSAQDSNWAEGGIIDKASEACTDSACSQNAKIECATNFLSFYCVEQ